MDLNVKNALFNPQQLSRISTLTSGYDVAWRKHDFAKYCSAVDCLIHLNRPFYNTAKFSNVHLVQRWRVSLNLSYQSFMEIRRKFMKSLILKCTNRIVFCMLSGNAYIFIILSPTLHIFLLD